mgnify:CR=1 FL=1
MTDNYNKKIDKIEKYRNMQYIMRNQIRKLESIIQYQSKEMEYLEDSIIELKNIIGEQRKQNQDYIDANYLDQIQTHLNDSSDDISITSQDSLESSTMKTNELGGSVKKIYIQHVVS